MSWRDSLQPARFRDAEFAVDGHEGDVGRRVQLHEFPNRDKPYAEDLGRKARVLAVDALVVGEDYVLARNKLLAALEAKGPGKLVHPYWGELRVSVLRSRIRESTREGGLARFSIEFVEAGEARFPGSDSGVTTASLMASATAASQAAYASVRQRFSVARAPQFVAQASSSIVVTALNGMAGAVGKVRGAADQVAALQRGVDETKRDITAVIFAPASAAQALAGNLQLLVRGVASGPRDALALARSFYSFGFELPSISASTTSRAAQARNQRELLQLVRTTAAAEGARAAAALHFDSYQDAIAVRDEIVGTLDGLMLAATSDELYDALRALSAATVRDIAARGGDLARLVTWAPPATMPVLAVVQRLYADATREAELLARNAVRHPLFVAGGRPLEVLSDAV